MTRSKLLLAGALGAVSATMLPLCARPVRSAWRRWRSPQRSPFEPRYGCGHVAGRVRGRRDGPVAARRHCRARCRILDECGRLWPGLLGWGSWPVGWFEAGSPVPGVCGTMDGGGTECGIMTGLPWAGLDGGAPRIPLLAVAAAVPHVTEHMTCTGNPPTGADVVSRTPGADRAAAPFAPGWGAGHAPSRGGGFSCAGLGGGDGGGERGCVLLIRAWVVRRRWGGGGAVCA